MVHEAPIRWGILGAGRISAIITRDLELVQDSEAAAVGSRSLASAERFAAEHGITRAYGSYEELVADPSVDVVYVGVTNNAHLRAARLCLEAGKPVLCEKPFTVDVAQAQELVALARAKGLFLMEAMWMWCQPGFRRLVDDVRNGLVGEVRQVVATLGFSMPYSRTHRLYNPDTAGGAILDLGPYVVGFGQALLGAPTDLVARSNVREGVDLSTVIACRWPGGETGALDCSIEAHVDSRAAFVGAEGRVEVPAPFFRVGSWTVNRRGEEPEVIHTPFEGAGYVHMLAEVARCLREGLLESPLVPLDASLATMGLFDTVRHQVGLEYPPAAYA